MKLLRFIKMIWNLLFGKDMVKEIEHEAENEIDRLDDGKPIADYLNE